MDWFVQLTAGVVYWILPRLSGTHPRGNIKLVWLAFGLINLGIGMVILDAMLPLPALVLLGGLVEFVGVLIFVVSPWKRI